MVKNIFIMLCLTMLTAGTVTAANVNDSQAKDKKEKKDKKKKAAESDVATQGKTSGSVYVFGFSEQFGDSIVYFSPICKVDSIDIDKKTKFLPYRSDFSDQFRNHLERRKGCVMQTSCVFFAAKRADLSKKFYKIKKRYLEKDGRRIEVINEDEFKFVHPLDETYNAE